MTFQEKIVHDLGDKIARNGYSIVAVWDKDLPFAYTVGLQLRLKAADRHPDVIMFGCPVNTMHGILSGIAERTLHGQRYVPGRRYTDMVKNDFALWFRTVPEEVAVKHLTIATHFVLDPPFQALQLVWPDKEGRFPWEKGFDPRFEGLQPRLYV